MKTYPFREMKAEFNNPNLDSTNTVSTGTNELKIGININFNMLNTRLQHNKIKI